MLRSGEQQTAGHLVLTAEQVSAPARAGHGGSDRGPGVVGLAAAVLGVLSALLAVAVPLLPVIQDTVVITWPRPGHLAPVNAPLVGYQPQRLIVFCHLTGSDLAVTGSKALIRRGAAHLQLGRDGMIEWSRRWRGCQR